MSGICPLELDDLTNLRYLWMLVCNCYHGLCPTTLIRLEILLGLLDHLEGSFLICFHLLFENTNPAGRDDDHSPDVWRLVNWRSCSLFSKCIDRPN
jgi:hypothetical protein